MILALDVGNSQVYGGVFENSAIKLRFRKTSKSSASSDEYGVFLRNVLKENDLDPAKIEKIGVCSVVPDEVYSLRRACEKYFNRTPFILQAGAKTGLRIKYHNPLEVGADRISNAIAATFLYPKKDLIIVDLGTATTFCAISADKEYLGGTIIAGMRLSMQALEKNTAKLPTVEIVRCTQALGQSTVHSIQSGLYFGHIGQIKEISARLALECFHGEQPFIIGTGGLAQLLEKENIFAVIQPDLVLQGIVFALQLNN